MPHALSGHNTIALVFRPADYTPFTGITYNAKYLSLPCEFIMAFDHRKLRHLVAAARTGSFSRAAQELHISQPALSRSIAALEEQFSIRIFDRTSQGADLTNLGKLVVREADKLLKDVRLFEHNLDLYARGEAGKVGFGMWPLIGSLVLPDLCTHFIATRPHLIMTASAKPANALLKDLYNDEIELFFCGHGQFEMTADLEVEEIGQLRLTVLVRREHPLAGQAAVRRRDLLGHPKLCAVELSQIPAELMGSGVLVCDSVDTLRHAALHTDSIWFAPPQLAERELREGSLKSLSVIDTSPHTLIKLCMVRLRGAEITPAARDIAAYVRQYFDSLGAAVGETSTDPSGRG